MEAQSETVKKPSFENAVADILNHEWIRWATCTCVCGIAQFLVNSTIAIIVGTIARYGLTRRTWLQVDILRIDRSTDGRRKYWHLFSLVSEL